MEADFSGWASKANTLCTDGRTIMPGAFKHQDKITVPLVWQHGHSDPENVLGHAVLEDRPEGVYAFAYFNESAKAKHAATAVAHKDIKHMSIWANNIVQRGKKVMHGAIREVSLVLAGANPGALIENITVRHGDDDVEVLDEEVIIHSGEEFDKVEVHNVDVAHAEGDNGGNDSDPTLAELYDTMTDQQKNVVHYLVQQALEAADGNDGGNNDGAATEHSDTSDDNGNDKKGTETMTNVFEQQANGASGTQKALVISHDDMKGIFATADQMGSLQQAVEQYVVSHGIDDIELLFPEARALTTSPEFFRRRTEWVNSVISGATKSPFSRIKTWVADLTHEAARAKGYIKATMKKEEFFGVSRRITTPKTIYKKQKLDRDDIVDITDFDVVVWMKGEMRLMLEEEIARAVLIGDGRAVDDEDKINEDNIRPIAKDDEFYTVVVNVNIDDASSSYNEVIETLIRTRRHYRGSGQPTMYTTEAVIAEFLLLKDTLNRRLYRNLEEIASDLRLSSIIPVEVMEDDPTYVAVIVNMRDYNIGADKGGQVSLFDDFDIDFNQYKYLIETRMSGALTKPKSAMVVKKVDAAVTIVTPTKPTFNTTTGVVTIPTVTGVVYKNADTNATLSAGAQSALAVGATLNVRAEPASASYAFISSEGDTWEFTRPALVP